MVPQHPGLVAMSVLGMMIVGGLLLWFILAAMSAPYRMSEAEGAYIQDIIQEDNLQYNPPPQWSEDCPPSMRTRWDVESQSSVRVSDEG